MRTATHFAHEPLLLHFAAEVPQSLLELPGILDYDAHSPVRIPGTSSGLLLMHGNPNLGVPSGASRHLPV